MTQPAAILTGVATGMTPVIRGTAEVNRLTDAASPLQILHRIAETLAALESDRRSLERALELNPLTALGNRPALERARASADEDAELAWVAIDADEFKWLNDRHGHDAGDAALVHFASAIRQIADEFGIGLRAFHPHGDEFFVIVPVEYATMVACAIEGASTYRLGDVSTRLTAGVGATAADADAALINKKNEKRQGRVRRPGSLSGTLPVIDPHAEPDRVRPSGATPFDTRVCCTGSAECATCAPAEAEFRGRAADAGLTLPPCLDHFVGRVISKPNDQRIPVAEMAAK